MSIAAQIKEFSGIDLDALCVDWVTEQHNPFTKEDLAAVVKEHIYRAANESPRVFEKAVDDAAMTVAAGSITRLKQIKYEDGDGNIDWLAFSTMVVSPSRGMYVPIMFASIDAGNRKEQEQIENIEKAVHKHERYAEAWHQIRDVMVAHGYNTAGEALRRMGYI